MKLSALLVFVLLASADAKPKPSPTPAFKRTAIPLPSDDVIRALPRSEMDATDKHAAELISANIIPDILAAINERDTVAVALMAATGQITTLGHERDEAKAQADYWKQKHAEAVKKLNWWRFHFFAAGIAGIILLVVVVLMWMGKIAVPLAARAVV